MANEERDFERILCGLSSELQSRVDAVLKQEHRQVLRLLSSENLQALAPTQKEVSGPNDHLLIHPTELPLAMIPSCSIEDAPDYTPKEAPPQTPKGLAYTVTEPDFEDEIRRHSRASGSAGSMGSDRRISRDSSQQKAISRESSQTLEDVRDVPSCKSDSSVEGSAIRRKYMGQDRQRSSRPDVGRTYSDSGSMHGGRRPSMALLTRYSGMSRCTTPASLLPDNKCESSIDPDRGSVGSFVSNAGRSQMSDRHLYMSTTSSQGARYLVAPVWCHHDECYEMRRNTSANLCKANTTGTTTRRQNTSACIHYGLPNSDERSCILQPTSFSRIVWDLLGMTFIMWDVIFIPFQLFDPPAGMLDAIGEWTTRIFWTLDMPASMVTGFFKSDGQVELRRNKILRRYVMSWFFLDLAVNGCDWAEVALGGSSGTGGVQGMRVIRILRMIRLLRIIRMPQIFAAMAETMGVSEFELSCNIMKNICFFLGFAHLIACCWYAIGKGTTGDFESWVEKHNYTGAPLHDRYLTSLHWSVTQFLGNMEISPVNWYERCFACMVLVIAFVISTWFVSNITSAMTRHHMLKTRQVNQFAQLKTFLSQHSISQNLVARIQRHAQFSLKMAQRKVPEADVELLHVISEPLRADLHFELYSSDLLSHPLLERYHWHAPGMLEKVCHSAVSVKFLSFGDIVFNYGESPLVPEMFFIRRGELKYKCGDGQKTPVKDGDYLLEQTLWTVGWTTVGQLRSYSECQIMSLNSASFQDISIQYQGQGINVSEYALAYVRYLNENLHAVNDLGNRDETWDFVKEAFDEDIESLRSTTSSILPVPSISLTSFSMAARRTSDLSQHSKGSNKSRQSNRSKYSRASRSRNGNSSWLPRVIIQAMPKAWKVSPSEAKLRRSGGGRSSIRSDSSNHTSPRSTSPRTTSKDIAKFFGVKK